MKYKLTAKVRKVGAIGIFYPVDFIIEMLDISESSKIKQKWFELYGDDWELYHFISIEKTEDSTPIEVTEVDLDYYYNRYAK